MPKAWNRKRKKKQVPLGMGRKNKQLPISPSTQAGIRGEDKPMKQEAREHLEGKSKYVRCLFCCPASLEGNSIIRGHGIDPLHEACVTYSA